MFTKSVPVKDLYGKPRNVTVHFNLYEREVFKLLVEFKALYNWREAIAGEKRELTTEEVVEFYNILETILLASYGKPSDDGLEFDHTDSYKFEMSVTFNEIMKIFLTDQEAANKLLDGLMPEGLGEMIQKADENALRAIQAKDTTDEQRSELEALRARLADLEADKTN